MELTRVFDGTLISLCQRLPSSKTRWFARRWRRSAGNSLDSAAFTSLLEEDLEEEQVEREEVKQWEELKLSRSLRCPRPLCLELHRPPLLPAPPAGGRLLEEATSAGM